MLIPKATIFIVYGHDARLLEDVKSSIEEQIQEGQRVKYELLNEDKLRTQKKPSIFEALKEAMSTADAAIILTTTDDLACKKSELQEKKLYEIEELEHILKPRARQNVILELGMLMNMLGENKLLILTERRTEPPSDLIGRFWEYIESSSDAQKRTREFVKSVSINAQGNLLSKSDLPIRFSELEHCSDAPINTFEQEYAKLDEPWEKALYLSERIVFDSYIQKSTWWRDRLRDIDDKNDMSLRCAINILNLALDYMEAWMPPDKMDFQEIEVVCDALKKEIDKIKEQRIKIAPIVLIVAYDYLGLAYNKLSRVDSLSDDSEKNLINAVESFGKCIELSDLYDNSDLSLWTGYATFNKARSINELIGKVTEDKRDQYREDWKVEMQKTMSIRKKWKKTANKYPDVIKDGLITEYFHAVAERLLRAERNDRGEIDEKGRASIDGRWEAEEKRLFDEWWDNPRGLRVRLAFNVKENWKKIPKFV